MIRNAGLIDHHAGRFSTIGSTRRWRQLSRRAASKWSVEVQLGAIRIHVNARALSGLSEWAWRIHRREREGDNWTEERKKRLKQAACEIHKDGEIISSRFSDKRAARDRWCSHKCCVHVCMDEMRCGSYTRRLTSLSSPSSPAHFLFVWPFSYMLQSQINGRRDTAAFIRLRRWQTFHLRDNLQHLNFDPLIPTLTHT